MVKVRETTRECRRTSKNSEKGEHMATLLLFFFGCCFPLATNRKGVCASAHHIGYAGLLIANVGLEPTAREGESWRTTG